MTHMLPIYLGIHLSIQKQVPDLLQISPLYSVQSTPVARFLIENGISMKPQCLDQDRERFRHFALQAAASTK